MIIAAIDPGKTFGWVVYDSATRRVLDHGHGGMWECAAALGTWAMRVACDICIEWPDAYGSLPQADLYRTMFAAGRCAERLGVVPHEISRRDVKKHLLGRVSGTDANLRAALVAEFGEDSDKPAPRCPTCKGRGHTRNVMCSTCKGSGKVGTDGPLSMLSGSHEWSALAVAVTFAAREGKS